MPDVKLNVKDIKLNDNTKKVNSSYSIDFLQFVKDLPKILIVALLTMKPDELNILREKIENCLPNDLIEKLKKIK